MKTIEEIPEFLKQVDILVQNPFVTAKFGDNWREYIKKTCDIDTIIEIAWRQGRKNIILEHEMMELFHSNKKV
jgi:hypothetical protein